MDNPDTKSAVLRGTHRKMEERRTTVSKSGKEKSTKADTFMIPVTALSVARGP